MKKVLSIILVLLLASSMLFACGKKEDKTTTEAQKETEEATEAEKKEDLDISIMTITFGGDCTDTLAQKAWEEKMDELMGCHLNITWSRIVNTDYAEKLSLAVNSDDLPDIVTFLTSGSSFNVSSIIQYGEEGYFVNLRDYWDDIPNYKAVLEAGPSSNSSFYTEGGDLYGFYCAYTYADAPTGGAGYGYSTAIRTDIFDTNGIAYPTTLDELLDAARTLKEIYPELYPVYQSEEWSKPDVMFWSAYHVTDSFYYNGEKYVYGPITENYKHVLEGMHTLYEEGLISPDFFTMKQADGSAIQANQESFICANAWYGYPEYWSDEETGERWALITDLPDTDYYDHSWSFSKGVSDTVSFSTNYGYLVNAAGEHIEECIKICDLQYAEEVYEILNWGIEGETFEVAADGTHTYIGVDQYDSFGDFVEANGFAMQGSKRSGIFPCTTDKRYSIATEGSQNYIVDGKEISISTNGFLREYYDESRVSTTSLMVTGSKSSEQAEQETDTMTDITTYVSEMRVKFITGERSLDEFDDFVAEVNAMGDIQAICDIYDSLIIGEKQ